MFLVTNIQYHDFNNDDALTFKDKYTALLQQELQNQYWCLLDPTTTKSYQISSEMDVETMPHAMYFSGNKETIAKINQVPYQVIEYDDKGMFQVKLMDNTQVEMFIDNRAMPLHDPISRNCAVSMSYTYIILPHNLNSTELHLQGVAPRSQYSDHMPEAVTLQ